MGKIPITVVPVGTQLYTQEASCYSPCCWSGATFHHRCEGWVSHNPGAQGGKAKRTKPTKRTNRTKRTATVPLAEEVSETDEEPEPRSIEEEEPEQPEPEPELQPGDDKIAEGDYGKGHISTYQDTMKNQYNRFKDIFKK